MSSTGSMICGVNPLFRFQKITPPAGIFPAEFAEALLHKASAFFISPDFYTRVCNFAHRSA